MILLDADACYRAIETRDARFDGQFFTGVATTRIYCRPVCPVRPPKKENCRFFLSAAAAQEAGFRPCLRCRPEVSPGLPAWIGTSVTVSRALRMIEDGFLDDGSVEDLAARLGVGDRHLRRLFLEHLGATPVAVALNRRVLFAKKLLTETLLPVAEIAFTAGFGSLRRFNDAMQEVYARSPRELRRGTAEETAKGPLKLRLGYRAPYDWHGLLRFLAARAIPGVEQVEGGVYRRTIRIGGTRGRIEVREIAEANAVEAMIDVDRLTDLRAIVERIKRLFDLRANAMEIARHLQEADPSLGYRAEIRVPGCWDPFELSVRAILGQQVTVAGATTLAGRIVKQWGEPFDGGYLFPSARVLREADFASIGVTSRRAETLRAVAAAFDEGAIDLSPGLAHIEHMFCLLEGIGPWTAHYIAMRAANEPDAFPSGDLALRKAAGNVTQKQLEARAEAWKPWRAYAAMHLWSSHV